MEYKHQITESRKSYCFPCQGIEGYASPATVCYKEMLEPSGIIEKQNMNQKYIKPGSFDKCKRVSPFHPKQGTIPGPGCYCTKENKKPIVEARTLKLDRFNDRKKITVGVGQYQFEKASRKISFLMGENIDRAHRVSYFENIDFQKAAVPGPGSYNEIIRSNSTKTLDFARSTEKRSTSKEPVKKQKDRPPGPSTYLIKRPKSTSCSSLLIPPLKQTDSTMKKRLKEYRKERSKMTKTGPGSYLKIQKWAPSQKQYPNGYVTASRPQLRIYN